jgi:hypothetical protein
MTHFALGGFGAVLDLSQQLPIATSSPSITAWPFTASSAFATSI